MSRPEDGLRTLDTKVVLLGSQDVGKTSMVNRYIRGHFLSSTTATIGAAFFKRELTINNWKVLLQIWDTAGQERFRSMAPMYYRHALAAILVFDATSPDSLDKIEDWVKELNEHASPEISLFIACNKSDLRDSQQGCVTIEQAQAFAQKIKAPLFETSAKTGKGIEELFAQVARALIDKEMQRMRAAPIRSMSSHDVSPLPILTHESDSDESKRKKCC